MTQNFNIYGIISEFNPLHLGHEHLITRTKRAGATHIAAIMSGNFVQRGESACFDKWVRTKAALSAGVDLVIELPLPWAISGAQTFAQGGIALANAIGCLNGLSFGSECGEIAPLAALANLLDTPAFAALLQRKLKTGISFAAARQSAVQALTDAKTATLLEHPNNILAIAYCRALKQTDSQITPFTVKRTGASHNETGTPNHSIASSSQIRVLLAAKKNYQAYIPQSAYPYFAQAVQNNTAPAALQYVQRAILAKLRTMSVEDFANLPDVSEGLEHRLYQAAKSAVSLQEFYSAVKTKRYSHARIRRITLCAFLNVQAAHTLQPPPYLRILGFAQKSKELLSLLKQTATLPVITQYSQLQTATPHARAMFALESAATDLYNLTTPQPQPCGKEFTQGIITV